MSPLDPVVDFAIRHQTLSFTGLGLLLGVALLALPVRGARQRPSPVGGVGPSGPDRRPVRALLVSPALLPFTIAAIIAVVAVAVLGSARPIPPSAGLALPPPLRDRPGNRALLLFIHGWNGDASGTWGAFPRLALTDPRLSAYNVWSIDYPTYLARRNLGVAQLADFIAHHLEATGKVSERYRVVVIAHSLGGLLARELVLRQALQGGPAPIRKLIEIATPHEGADVAGLAFALGVSRALTGDMKRGSAFLRDQRTHWQALGVKPATFCIGSRQDGVVPLESASSQCVEGTSYPSGDHRSIVQPDSLGDFRYAIPVAEVLKD